MAHMSRSVITSCRSIGGRLAGARAAYRRPAFSTNVNPFGSGRDIPDLRRRFSSISRFPVELACCVESLIPLHSAVASSRLTSRLAINSRSLSQGKLLAQGVRCCNIKSGEKVALVDHTFQQSKEAKYKDVKNFFQSSKSSANTIVLL